MSSLIEQAALRLEQLRQAGAVIPEIPPRQGVAPTTSAPSLPEPAPVAPVSAAHREPTLTSRRVELDETALAASGIVTPQAPRSHAADQYRVIKRPLISNAMRKGASMLKHGNLIMVTSALAGEGKSYTSVNLAMSIAAELDHTVMLVDADVARPSLLRMLGLPPGPGLLDVLKGNAEMSSVLLRTSVEKLTILPSGTPHPRATELLASDAMRLLLDDIAQRYADRIIIFDSPPLLLTTEARVLATQVGQVVMVVQAEKTLRADVQHALSTIDSCPVRLMLLNMSRVDSVAGYGGAYGYGYGYGAAHEQASGTQPAG
jgi:protein-tyrosine kinase